MTEFIMKANGVEIEKLTWYVNGMHAEIYSSSLGQLFGGGVNGQHQEAKSAYVGRVIECKAIGEQMKSAGMTVEYSER